MLSNILIYNIIIFSILQKSFPKREILIIFSFLFYIIADRMEFFFQENEMIYVILFLYLPKINVKWKV